MSVNKSYDTNDPIKNYCLAHSSSLHPVQVKLNQETMKHSRVSVLPQVIDNCNVISVSDARRPRGDQHERPPHQEPRRQEGPRCRRLHGG